MLKSLGKYISPFLSGIVNLILKMCIKYVHFWPTNVIIASCNIWLWMKTNSYMLSISLIFLEYLKSTLKFYLLFTIRLFFGPQSSLWLFFVVLAICFNNIIIHYYLSSSLILSRYIFVTSIILTSGFFHHKFSAMYTIYLKCTLIEGKVGKHSWETGSHALLANFFL